MGLFRPTIATHLALVVGGALAVGGASLMSWSAAAQSTPRPTPRPSPQALEHAREKNRVQVQVQDALKACFQCHGEGGVSSVSSRPTIAGQKVEYLRRQLLAFKIEVAQGTLEGAQRKNPLMEHMISGLGDHLIGPIATALSQLACDGGISKTARAKPLFLPPAAKKCAQCHGVDGIGRQAQIPNLAGQQRSYLRRQVLLIREIAWGAKPREGDAWRSHPIMESQVARLKITDLDAIANYYAALNCRGADRGASGVKRP